VFLQPTADTVSFREAVRIEGVLVGFPDPLAISQVTARSAGTPVGTTSLLFTGNATGAGAPKATDTQVRFSILADLRATHASGAVASIAIDVADAGGRSWSDVAVLRTRIATGELESRAYGGVLAPHNDRVMHREHIYSSGPSSALASEECMALIRRYLEAGEKILDVGCGVGAYGRRLLQLGYDWVGVEIKESDLNELTRLMLPHRRVAAAGGLPFGDGELDAAICIEVLEHVADTSQFLAEIARVTKRVALFSVPNIEAIPMYQPLGVVPWHLLEATHVNFFTRYNLVATLQPHFARVEILDYGMLPVTTPEGCSVANHLFAIAKKAP
jgi:2-polyprenyl-3-methyl-5-hydroxy-6-metoxy-1,4-benzoquinol methylase